MYEIETNIPFVEETFTSEDQFYSQSKDCKYKICYQRIIERARNRIVKGYVEKHHIVPKCLGGSNDEENLVKISYNNSIRGVSEETKIKMSISHKNMSIETKLKIGESSKKARAIEKELGIGMYSKESIEKRRILIKESWNLRKLKQGCL